LLQVLISTGLQKPMPDTSPTSDTTPDSVLTESSPVPVKPTSVKVPLAREPSALDPTRYGDWEKNGRCIDF
jgi:hypothetical protein